MLKTRKGISHTHAHTYNKIYKGFKKMWYMCQNDAWGARGHSKSCGGELEELILAILLLHWTVGHLLQHHATTTTFQSPPPPPSCLNF